MPSHVPTYGNFFKFKKDDVFRNRIKTFPKVNFFIYTGSVYYNNENQKKANHHTPTGHINLYELNVFRNLHSASDGEVQMIYPFVTKQGSFSSFKTVSTSDFNLDFSFGDEMAGTYPLTASITVNRYDTALSTEKRNTLNALRNTFDYYAPLSPHYAYSSSFGEKENQKLNIISIPSIFYGSSIKKGSVKLKFYVSGTLIAEAADTKKDGRLIQISGSTTGSTVGLALYNEGFLVLTSSVGIDVHKETYAAGDAVAYSASWHYFGATDSYANAPSSSYSIEFSGVNYIETITMFANAKENQVNFSNNPTFLTSSINFYSGSDIYYEDAKAGIKNIVSSSYKNYSASFKPVTYISKVGIYDKDKNLIAIAGLANPVRKLEERSYTFKLKLDI